MSEQYRNTFGVNLFSPLVFTGFILDLEYVKPKEISDKMFAIIDKIKTGRREYDDESVTTTTILETR